MAAARLMNIESDQETLEVFDYYCSHTMCSPLKTMQGLLNLLEHEADSVQRSLYMEMILQTAGKLEVIVKELNQAVSGMDAQIIYAPVDFREILTGILKEFEFRLKLKGMAVFVEIDQLSPFLCDPQRLTTIFTHLICNAIVFSDNKKPHSFLSIKGKVTEYGCSLTIEDNGCGFAPEMHKKIFQPFFRGSDKSTGPGLGLFIVAETIKKLDAAMFVESRIGEGSAFTLEFAGSAR